MISEEKIGQPEMNRSEIDQSEMNQPKKESVKSIESQTKSQKVRLYIVLHLLLMMFSVMGICSKIAANQEFMSFKFILYYGLMLAILAIYAVAWQQIIKRLPLTTAFANKAVTVVWGMVWGVVAFQEHISLNKVIGSMIIIAGIVLYSRAEEPEAESQKSEQLTEQEGK